MKKILYFLICLPFIGQAKQLFVSTTGAASGDGSVNAPYDLITALGNSTKITAGDTVWLRGGIYNNTYTQSVSGTANAPIVYRNYNNEQATLQGVDKNALITVNGNYVWFWGIEFMFNDTNRVTQLTGSNPADITMGTCINTYGANLKFINCIIRDGAGGFGTWSPSTDSEIYGCLVYNNGWDAPDRGHGHGIYAQNNTGKRYLHNNFIFHNYGYGIHAYTEGGTINGFDVRRNIVFNAGGNSYHGVYTNILIGGLQVAQNPVVKHNATYFNSNIGGANNFGYNAGTNNLVLDSNYFIAEGATATTIVNPANPTVTNNTFLGGSPSSVTYPNNTFLASSPSGQTNFVYPNKYEIGRANIAVYNWDGTPVVSVNVDISNVGLQAGDVYDLIHVGDYFNDIITATYNGSGTITIPLTNHTWAMPIGGVTPVPNTFPYFGAFLLRKSIMPASVNKTTISEAIIYPNPSNGKCEIVLKNNSPDAVILKLYTLTGEKVHEGKIQSNRYQLNIQHNSPGMYLFQIENKDGGMITSGKLILQ